MQSFNQRGHRDCLNTGLWLGCLPSATGSRVSTAFQEALGWLFSQRILAFTQ